MRLSWEEFEISIICMGSSRFCPLTGVHHRYHITLCTPASTNISKLPHQDFNGNSFCRLRIALTCTSAEQGHLMGYS